MALSGPEMLLKNLLGIDPRKMESDILGMIAMVKEMHTFVKEVNARLERLEHHLGVIQDEKQLPVSTDTSVYDPHKGAANG